MRPLEVREETDRSPQVRNAVDHPAASSTPSQIAVTLLTGGIDKHYSFGLASALQSKGVALDVIGSDDLDCKEFRTMTGVNFINLRGSQQPDASLARKTLRLGRYYARLIAYAATAKPRIFHILWNNRCETFDRTLLMLYYKLLGKGIVLTAHNINAARRDAKDSVLNRLTLRAQYRLADNVFVHTEKMKRELVKEFGVPEARVSLITYGINNAVPDTRLTPRGAKRRLDIREDEKVLLFFGRITPYKGLEHLVAAFHEIAARDANYRLIIAGVPQKCAEYWNGIRESVLEDKQKGRVLLRAEHIPDDEVEIYFKASDALVLPYRAIYQSGILFLGYSFGLPVLAADVGSLKDEVVEGKTGFVFRPEDPDDLASAIDRYFASDLYANLNRRRQAIKDYAAERHSWDTLSEVTTSVYGGLLQMPFQGKSASAKGQITSLGAGTR